MHVNKRDQRKIYYSKKGGDSLNEELLQSIATLGRARFGRDLVVAEGQPIDAGLGFRKFENIFQGNSRKSDKRLE